MVLTDIKHDNHVEAQTVREWLYAYDYSQGKPVWPSSWGGDVKAGYLVVPDDYRADLHCKAKPVAPKRVRVRI